MKKSFLSFALAVMMTFALCIGLSVPAFAAYGPPAYKVSVSTNGAVKKDMDFTLRNITEETSFEGGAIRSTYTRNQETETSHQKGIPVLSPNASIIVSGLRTHIDANDWVDLSAWSDPDGDGIFDQQLIIGIGSIPTLEEGPFVYQMGVSKTGYSTDILLTHSNSLDSDIVPGETMSQPTIELSAAFITKTFGPNTLIKLEIWTRTAPQNGGWFYDRNLRSTHMFYVPNGTPDHSDSTAFTDVPAGEWYADPVAWAVEKGITNGTEPGKFSPNQDCTHIQILTFLWRAANKPASTVAIFSEFPGDYAPAANWAYEKGIIGNSFIPNAVCTRSQAVNYIWQALGKPPAKASSFTDVPASAAYAKAVDWAVEKGVTKGDGSESTFAPNKVCSRGHIVTFLYRAYAK